MRRISFFIQQPGQRLLQGFALAGTGLAALLAGLGPCLAVTASMLFSLLVYVAAFGVHFALGLLGLLLAHELGHLLASRVAGLPVSGPLFVPFVGAVISLRRPPRNAKIEANVAIGGPAIDLLAGLVFLVFYLWTDNLLLLVLAYTAGLLNLINLLPCAPLDGGKIAAAISPRLWWAGSAALGLAAAYTRNLFVLGVFFFSLYQLWRGERPDPDAPYYRLTLRQRLTVACWYFGLMIVSAVMTLYMAKALQY